MFKKVYEDISILFWPLKQVEASIKASLIRSRKKEPIMLDPKHMPRFLMQALNIDQIVPSQSLKNPQYPITRSF